MKPLIGSIDNLRLTDRCFVAKFAVQFTEEWAAYTGQSVAVILPVRYEALEATDLRGCELRLATSQGRNNYLKSFCVFFFSLFLSTFFNIFCFSVNIIMAIYA